MDSDALSISACGVAIASAAVHVIKALVGCKKFKCSSPCCHTGDATIEIRSTNSEGDSKKVQLLSESK